MFQHLILHYWRYSPAWSHSYPVCVSQRLPSPAFSPLLSS
uniref:Uncharacterized protein n=1 Tax=Anguilla anguilla TaxID=7936 RepID=A0A0E9RN20_ANGAN